LAFKIIISAYQNKVTDLENKIYTLEETLKSKELKYNQIEKNLLQNNTNFKDYENSIERLTNENIYLMETVKKLSEENKTLIKYKTKDMLISEDEMKKSVVNINNSQYRLYSSDNVDNLMDNLNANNYREDLSTCSDNNSKAIERRILDFKNKLKNNPNFSSQFSSQHNSPKNSGNNNFKTPELYKSKNNRLAEIYDYSPRSNQFLLSSRFFNQCKASLSKEQYDSLINLITYEKDDLHRKVDELLSGHSELISDFKILFKI
jgi:hypothetical protein